MPSSFLPWDLESAFPSAQNVLPYSWCIKDWYLPFLLKHNFHEKGWTLESLPCSIYSVLPPLLLFFFRAFISAQCIAVYAFVRWINYLLSALENKFYEIRHLVCLFQFCTSASRIVIEHSIYSIIFVRWMSEEWILF